MQRSIHSTVLLSLISSAAVLPVFAFDQPSDVTKRITVASPAESYARPKSRRKLLVFTLTRGFRHGSIPVGVEAMKILGKQTGAFETVHSEDIAMFEPDTLKQFDAVCMLNTTGELFLPGNLDELSVIGRMTIEQRDARLKKSLLDFVENGKGLIGIHAATDCFYKWSAYGDMIGGYFDGHPWHEDVVIKVEDTDHPLCAPLGGPSLEIKDEIYQFRNPYSRSRQRVLLSVDTYHTAMTKKGIRRTDGDFAVSWVRRQGKGRVFYCSLGHRDEIYWNPKVLGHYLAGIQYALGDLEADARPVIRSRASDWAPLFNGKDLTGWKGLVGDPKSRATMSSSELANAQSKADEKMRAHWSAKDGVLMFDGKGDSICTAKDYKDVELRVEWKIQPGGDSGVYLRGSPQVQIWDPAQWPEGSGGLYNNKHNPSKPLLRADNPVGQWNTFLIKMINDRVTVRLNNRIVVDDVVLENYWERDKPIYPMGQIELQSHHTPLQFKNVAIREIPPDETLAVPKRETWRELFNGTELTGWQAKEGSWTVEDGTLARKGGGDIWSQERFGDFTLELEFKFVDGANSGIFFRTGDIKNCVQTGIELQVLDSYGKSEVGKHDCGAIYDCLAPAVNAVKRPGEWNHVVLTCRGPWINAVMNGRPIINMNLDRWTDPHKNADGSKNKFRTAYKDMPREGHIGFQDHGKPVWYRNIRIKRIED